MSTKSTIFVNWTFTVGVRRLVYHDPKIVAASGAGSGYVPGHGGRRHIVKVVARQTPFRIPFFAIFVPTSGAV
jgi:hypothetical protein